MTTQQQTLKSELRIEGIGLHSGCSSVLTLKPAEPDTGITFRRIDTECALLPAKFDCVVDTANCTCLGAKNVRVSTIEHLMASLYATGIDNVLIECNNTELPIMDGSAMPFYDLLKKAEKAPQSSPRHFLKVLKNVRFEDSKGQYVELSPSETDELSVYFEIEFPSKIVGKQIFNAQINASVFEREIAPCRTFCEKAQIDYLRSLGLIKGGSLDNAVVLDGDSILNPNGFRVEGECVRHKVLDAIGDLYTSGAYICGRLTAYHTGHYHNNELLKRLFEDPTNYRLF